MGTQLSTPMSIALVMPSSRENGLADEKVASFVLTILRGAGCIPVVCAMSEIVHLSKKTSGSVLVVLVSSGSMDIANDNG